MRTRFIALLILSAAATLSSLGMAQEQAPSFEVASVKRNTDPVLTVSGVEPKAGGRLSAKAATLKQLIANAYHLRDQQISGGTAWMDSERYDIEASAGKAIAWEPGLREMLQKLLADRFQLRVHMETRDRPVYEMTVAKGGPKLKRMQGECTPRSDGLCGGYATRIGIIAGQKASMAQLAEALSAILDRPVSDKTGVDGLFDDVKLEWVPDETQYQSWGAEAYKRAASDPSGASLFSAIQEQLGLKLTSAKGPVEFLVIDHAEKPTEN